MWSLVVGEAAVLAVIAAFFIRPVSRARLERFAVRQRLVITADNGPMVMRYLFVTRAWRVSGFAAGTLIAWLATYTAHSGQNIGQGGSVVGWFAGALIAERYIDVGVPGQARRRASSLTVRRAQDYLPGPELLIALLLNLGTVGYAGWMLAAGDGDRTDLAVALVILIGVDVVLWWVARHVLDRRQPLTEVDLVAADDALRSRSLHVLLGCSVAFAGTLMAVVTTADQHLANANANAGTLVVFLGGLGLPIIGAVLAFSPFAVRRVQAIPQVVTP